MDKNCLNCVFCVDDEGYAKCSMNKKIIRLDCEDVWDITPCEEYKDPWYKRKRSDYLSDEEIPF